MIGRGPHNYYVMIIIICAFEDFLQTNVRSPVPGDLVMFISYTKSMRFPRHGFVLSKRRPFTTIYTHTHTHALYANGFSAIVHTHLSARKHYYDAGEQNRNTINGEPPLGLGTYLLTGDGGGEHPVDGLSDE